MFFMVSKELFIVVNLGRITALKERPIYHEIRNVPRISMDLRRNPLKNIPRNEWRTAKMSPDSQFLIRSLSSGNVKQSWTYFKLNESLKKTGSCQQHRSNRLKIRLEKHRKSISKCKEAMLFILSVSGLMNSCRVRSLTSNRFKPSKAENIDEMSLL